MRQKLGLTVISRHLVLITSFQFEPGELKHLIDFKSDLFLHFEAAEKIERLIEITVVRRARSETDPGSIIDASFDANATSSANSGR